MYEKYYPVVVQAVTGENKAVYAYFSDGRITHFDLKPLISKRGIFINANLKVSLWVTL